MASTEKVSETFARKEKFGMTKPKSLRERVDDAAPVRAPSFERLKFTTNVSCFVTPDIVKLPVVVAFHDPSEFFTGMDVVVEASLINSFAAWSDFKINLPIAPSR